MVGSTKRVPKGKWTDAEIQIMVDNLELPTAEITQLLNLEGYDRTESAVKYKFCVMHLGRMRQEREKVGRKHKVNWSDEEIQILTEHEGAAVPELVRMLAEHGYTRTEKAVRWKLAFLGLKVDGEYLSAYRKTLCWTCKHSHALGCPWHRCFRPIKGWKVIETQYTYPTKQYKGYTVIDCPLYEVDKDGH